MFNNYHIIEEIYQSDYSLIYQAREKGSKQPVILKVLRETHPSPARIARFKQEYKITQSLQTEGIIKVYALEKMETYWVMVLEDFGGYSLSQLNLADQLSLPEFLQLAIAIADALGQVHQQQIIHKDITPANIVFNPHTKQIKLIDFGISTLLVQETPVFAPPSVLEGTLAYISPEQTGRMNKPVDYRTDFYALGATLYHLLIGHPPYQVEDALTLLHYHLAKNPPAPHHLKPDIPKVVSNIILKLMSKSPQRRYQSAYGLKADLGECLRYWTEKGAIPLFQLGYHDRPSRFQISQKLYGRTQEIETLLTTFEQAITNHHRQVDGAEQKEKVNQPLIQPVHSFIPTLVLITGQPGIGKSALVKEIYKPITQKRGYFIAGKFDQLQRNIPHQAFIQAFQGLIKQLLRENESEIKSWCNQLQAALTPNGQVIIDMLPELALIIGPQPPTQPLDPTQNLNRFNFVFQNFVTVFAQQKHPLVIFIDDLQWADTSSLNLLHTLLTEIENPFLFIIGAYRNQEITPQHLLHLTLDTLANEGVILKKISPSPLNTTQVNKLLADTFNCQPTHTQALSALIFHKTQGNPFFINQFLHMLYTENLIRFSHIATGKADTVGWYWHLPEIEARNITDNVVTLMINKLQKLPQATQNQLQLAACIGNRFDLKTLSIIAKQSTTEVLSTLQPALQEGVLRTLGENYKLFDEEENPVSVDFRFLHDQIQQAAYLLIPAATRQSIHLKLGYLLLQVDNLEAIIFDVVNHLNQGRNLVTTKTEKYHLANLNLRAGKKAKKAGAYHPALIYFATGQEYLPSHSWQTAYPLTFELYKEHAEVAYLNSDYEQSEKLLYVALNQAKTALEQAELYKILVIQYTMANKPEMAIQVGIKSLHLLGEDLPQANFEAVFEAELKQAQTFLAGKKVTSLLNEPVKETTQKMKILFELFRRLGAPTYYFNPTLFRVIIVKMVNISLQYGHIRESGKVYGSYAMMLSTYLGDYQTAYEFATLSIELCKNFNDFVSMCIDCYTMGTFIIPWLYHIKESQVYYKQSHQIGLDNGELLFVGYTLMHKIFVKFYQGHNLVAILDETNKSLVFAQKTKNLVATEAMIGCQLILNNLSGQTENENAFNTNTLTEAQFVETCETNNKFTSLCRYKTLKAQALYIYGKPIEGLKCAESIKDKLAFIQGIYQIAEFNFYYSLCLAAVYPTVSPKTKKTYWQQLETNQTQMEIWLENCDPNFKHKHLVVAAEMARLQGDNWKAAELYEQAIDSAAKYNFIQNKALICEIAANFYLAQQKPRLAYGYLSEAHYHYQLWGANHKTALLKKDHPQLLTQSNQLSPLKMWDTTQSIIAEMNTNKIQDLDLATVMKAAQAISSEIELDKLLKKLMEILIEGAGAEHSALILVQQDQLFIEAQSTVGQKDIPLLQSLPIEATVEQTNQTTTDTFTPPASHLAPEVIYYVARTQKSLLLPNASHQGDFTDIPYVIQNQPKSILCTPLLNQGNLLGLIYLENNLTTNAFTSAQVKMVNLLGTQASISITNSQAIKAKVEQDRLRLENEFLDKQARDLEKLNADKDKFFSIVSHDLRTPFTTLLAYSEKLLKTLTHLPPPDFELIRSIHQSTHATYTLLENLLSWSRLQRGHMAYQPQGTPLWKLAQNVVDVLKEAAIRKDINLTQTIPPNVWVVVDHNMIELVIRNLVSNALKFTFSGGQVTINASLPSTDSQVTLNKAKAKVTWLEVAVSDTGIGIAPADEQKLFKIDVHHTTSGTLQETGTGLGLIMCQEMVFKHGGNIWLESILGQGTTIKFTIPLDKINTILPHEIYPEKEDPQTEKPINKISPITPTPLLVPPPPYQLEVLYDLALTGDMKAIKKLATDMEKINRQLAPFAKKVKQLATGFEDEAIINLLEDYLN